MSISGKWELTAETSMGAHNLTLTIVENETKFSGELAGYLGTAEIDDGIIDGDKLIWSLTTKPLGKPVKLDCSAKIEGHKISGKIVAPGLLGEYEFTGNYLSA